MIDTARPDRAGDIERLGFRVGDAFYALPTSEVIEVLRPCPLARVPHAPASLLGVANLRGAILPVVSAARLVGADALGGIERSSRVLVLDHRPVCGLLVDAVSGLVREAAQPFDAASLLAAAVTRGAKTARRSLGEGAIAAPAAIGEDDSLAVLDFALEGQAYALPLDCVVEIMPAPRTMRGVADMDPAVVGLVAQRGLLLPVISLGRLLGLGDEGKRASLVVVKLAGGVVALAVDEVRSILRLRREKIDQVPAVLTRGSGETRLSGIARGDAGSLIGILSPERLFDEATQMRLARCVGRSERATAGANETVEDVLERFVVLTMDGEEYGLPIASVEEVVRRPDKLSPLPRSPSFVLGVMNLRGQAVPVLDGRDRFGAAPGASLANRIVVVSLQGLRTGFAVDAVSDIIAVAGNAITPAPDFASTEAPGGDAFRRIANHQGRLIFLVEPDALLAKAERDALAAATEGGRGRAKERKQAASAP